MKNPGIRQFPLSVSRSNIHLHYLRDVLHIKRKKQVQNNIHDE